MTAFERKTLENGLRVLTAPMPHVQSVITFVMYADAAAGRPAMLFQSCRANS